MNAIELRNVNKQLGDFSIQDISFKVPKGSIVGLIGQNGAGKTTTIKLMLDVFQRENGEIIYWGNKNIQIEDVKKDVAVVFDELSFYEKLTPTRINHIMKNIYETWDESYFFELLERFQLSSTQKVGEMSKGMKMKLNISIGLAHHPNLLLLDEPTSGLDPAAREDVLDLFLEFIQNEECSILFSSHITSDLEKIADYVVLMHDGKIILQENKDTLLYDYAIARCTSEQFILIPKQMIFSFEERKDMYNVIIKSKSTFEEAFPDFAIDNIVLDELLTISIKGEIVA